MKINDVEKLLGITKRNIRFYEQEGLLTPGRSENGYRDYSEADIARLKQIVILRKLGIPVQQIVDILDGALPLQEAVTANITALNEEIEKLNGSLALCQQLKAEDARTLDTERYWEIIQDNERQGMKFQSLISDYLHFLEPVWEDHFWFLTEVDFRKPWKVFLRFLLAGILWSLYRIYIFHENFWSSLGIFFLVGFCLFVIYIIGYIPIYRIGKKDPERAQQILTNVNIGIVFFGVVLVFLLILLYGSQLL